MTAKDLNQRLDELFADLGVDFLDYEGKSPPDQRSPLKTPVRISAVQSGTVQIEVTPEVEQDEEISREIPPHSIGREAIQGLISQFATTSDITERLATVVNGLGKILKTQTGTALLFNPGDTTQTVVAEFSMLPDVIPGIGLEFPLNFITDMLIDTHQPVFIQKGLIEPETRSIFTIMNSQGIQSRAIFPLQRNAEIIGCVSLDLAEKDRYFLPEDIRLIGFVIDQAINTI